MPVSVIIGQKNKLFNRKKFYNKAASNEKIQNQLVIIVYNSDRENRDGIDNSIVLSLRTIRNFDSELQKLLFKMPKNFKLYRP